MKNPTKIIRNMLAGIGLFRKSDIKRILPSAIINSQAMLDKNL